MEVNVAGLSVLIGMPVHGRIPAATALSLALTAQACGAGGIDLQIHMEGISPIQWARDCVLAKFLEGPQQKLFWIDSDQVWEPEMFLRLLALSTHKDVVGASYPSRSDESRYMINGIGELRVSDEFGLVEVGGFGLGFTIINRSVAEAVSKDKPESLINVSKQRKAREVFRFDTLPSGERRGEDIAFFADLRALGYPVYLDPTITLGHIGEKVWTGRAADHLARKEAA